MSEQLHRTPDFSGSGPVEYTPAPVAPAGRLAQVLAREQASLLAIEGVLSVGIGLGSPGAEALVIGVVDAAVAARLPQQIDGVPVMLKVSGPVDALTKR